MSTTTSPRFQAINLAGLRWRDGNQVGAFSAARPGFGVIDTHTGRLVASDGHTPSCWSRKTIAATHAQYTAEGRPTVEVVR